MNVNVAYPGRVLKTITGSLWLQLGLVGLLIGILWGSILLHLSQERAQYERAAVQDSGNLARGFAESINRTVEAVDQVMLTIRALYRADPTRFDITALAPGNLLNNELTLQIAYTDAKGMMLGSNLGPSAGVDLSDREHVRVHFADTSDLLFISKPVLGRVSQKWSIQFTRKLLDRDGKLAGVLIISLDPDYFSRFYQSLEIGAGSITLLGLDGVIRARAPAAASAVGQTINPATLGLLRGESANGTFSSISQVDNVERVFSYRRLAKYPLGVVVGLSKKEVFAVYEKDRRLYLMLGAQLTLLVVLIGMLLIRQGQRLLRSQRALSATLANISQGIMMVDSAGRIPVINGRAVDLLNIPPHLAQEGASFRDVLAWQLEHGEFDSGNSQVDVRTLAESGGLGVEFYERTRANGVVLEVRTRHLEDGGAVRTFTDVTERKKNEAALAAARDAAEAARSVQSDFLATMSHEIRTPMNAIIGMAGLLLDSGLPARQHRFASTLREAAESLMQIINDILDFSKLEAQRLEFETISFELPQVLDSITDLMQLKANEQKLWLRTTIAPGTPAHLVGDPGRLRQVLLNLVSNALKFTFTGGVTIDVSGQVGPDGRAQLHFDVTDTGIGIAPEAQNHLFEQFFQVDGSISRRFGGTGLGLAICRRLLEQMGGRISVISAPGIGSTFAFDAVFDIAAEPAVPLLEVEPPQASSAPRRLRILLAEDNATNRIVAVTRLEMLGHRVDAVANGAEAVQMVQVVPYDLVLMDVMMPEMDGLSATRAIRALSAPVSGIPIVAMTANVLRQQQDEYRAAGMDDFLGKPFTPEQLVRVLERAMAGRPVREDNGEAAPPGALLSFGRLYDDLGPEAAAALLRTFAGEAADRLTQMTRMLDAHDWDGLHAEAQGLHEASGSIGCGEVAGLAGDVAHSTDPVDVPSLMLQLRNRVQDAIRTIETAVSQG